MTHSYQLFCWLFINHPNVYTWWMKSSNQHAQTQEQRGTCIHALKTNGFDRSVLYLWQHTLTHTRLKTTPAIRVLTHKHTHTHLLCMYIPSGLRCVYFPSADSFVHSPVFAFCAGEKLSTEFPEFCTHFRAAEHLCACKYFMLWEASKLSFWNAG